MVGGTCLSVACDDNETYIVGTESGSIFKCKVGLGFNVHGQESGPFDEYPNKTIWWSKQAIRVMNCITNKQALDKVA